MSTNVFSADHNDSDFDVLIIGGGLVGCALACALGPLPLKVGLLDQQPLKAVPMHADQRKFALARASVNALGALGVITALQRPITPILRVHVSRAGDFGRVLIDAKDHHVNHLGAVVLAGDLLGALQRCALKLPNLTILPPSSIRTVHRSDDDVTIDTATGNNFRTRLLIGADGTHSTVRQALGIDVDSHDYQQTMIVCAITADKRPDGTAWERFTEYGPMALLPMDGGRYGAICSAARDDAELISTMNDAEYLEYFQQRFGWRAGRLQHASPRSAYPLIRSLAQRLDAPRALLIGNAAQTIHPIGAQGFNLGLRDALTLAELLGNQSQTDPGDPALLSAYVDARHDDRQRTLAFSDGLARLTSNRGLPAKLLRSIGLSALALDDGLRAPLIAGAMGFRGQVPALARSTQ